MRTVEKDFTFLVFSSKDAKLQFPWLSTIRIHPIPITPNFNSKKIKIIYIIFNEFIAMCPHSEKKTKLLITSPRLEISVCYGETAHSERNGPD
jgi:hypothetical protein